MIPVVITAAMLYAAAAPAVDMRAPFAVGETLEYGGKYSVLPFLGNVATGVLSVVAIDTADGVPTWDFRLTTNVSAAGIYKNHSVLESWTGVADFISRRFVHQINENGHQYSDDDFHIWADSGFYRNHNDTITHPTPKEPLDDLAFLYYIRTLSFKDGEVMHLARYFHNDHNPLELTVLGHEWVDMPDGSRRRCWVLHPVLDEPNGIFAAKTNARVWITDDGVRLPAQMKFSLGFGSVTLQLRKISRAP